jgi:GDP-4-dehydro-6-deoxy-D-mannose reductase
MRRDPRTERILITGAGGFLAGPLTKLLRGRGRIVRLGRTPAPGILACDLSDPAAARAAVRTAAPDVVFHLSGLTGSNDWDALWRAHATATVNLMEALAARGEPVRVVVAGSSAEYGAAGGARRVREDSPLEPVSLYGSCKLAQSLAALSYSRGPVEVLVARIFNVLGPGISEKMAPGAFARQIARVAAGLQPPEVVVGDLSPRRDYVDVRDVAAALAAIARRGRAGECYNVGSGRSVPMSAILRGLAAAAGVRVRERVNPARSKDAGVRNLVADTRKTAALGWTPRIPLKRSLADTLESWRRA